MKRQDFLKYLALSPLALSAMRFNTFQKLTDGLMPTPKMPVIFVGHGHPMNALYNNAFTQSLKGIAASVPKPTAIMVISAHWETRGTFVSLNPQPKTIYDFDGFDDCLLQIKYEPAGHPELAKAVIQELPSIKEDLNRGLDHGAWTVLKYMYPEADVPVFQFSIDYMQSAAKHYEIAQAIKKMREKGVLIIGSGNIVHNLGELDWVNIDAPTSDWALEFDSIVKTKLDNKDYNGLIDYKKLGTSALKAIPSEDHYIPMLYALGLAEANEPLTYLYEGFQYANIGMRCFKIG